MTVYNESANVSASSNVSAYANVSLEANASVFSAASTNATGNLIYKESSTIATDSSITADSVYSFSASVSASATMTAKSAKAIKRDLLDTRMDSFFMGNKQYFLNGQDYFYYDGNSCVEITPYIPTLFISKSPTGGGTYNEDFNLLGAGFKDSFSGDGTTTVYQLSLTNLDSTTVTAVVNNEAKAEGTDFTVDRTAGKVTFTTAPAAGTNNVIITAYKTQAGFPERIKKCTFHVLFGGTNDTRVFVSGNPDFPNQIWRSGLYDPTYFPENGFYKIGSDREKVTGFAKQYDYLVIEKESSKGNMQFQLDSSGKVSFPIKPLNDRIGTIAPNSIQIINNNPVSLDRTGVYILTQSNVRDERNIQHISANIDSLLLNEPNLEKAISVDFDYKYWLALNNKVYVYDYKINEWYLYDNIPATCFLIYNNILYFGGKGLVYRFKKETDYQPFNDDGQPINAYWKSKYLTFNADYLRKIVDSVLFSMKPQTHSSVDLYYTTNKKQSDLIKTKRMDLFNFWLMDFNKFSFVTSDFPQEVKTRIKAKKITHFQLMIQNNKLDEGLGILSLGIKFRYGSEVR